MTNESIADALNQIADALEEQEENPYRIRAYRRAANSLRCYSNDVANLVHTNVDLTLIPRVGIHLAEKIKQIVLTGETDIPKLKPAQTYPNKPLQKLRKPPLFRIYSAMYVIEKILHRLNALPQIQKLACASDYRRKRDVVGDIEIVIVTDDIPTTFEKFHGFPSIKYIIKTAKDFTIVQLKTGMQITLSAVSEKSFGAKLLQATGSNSHYEKIQELAHKNNLRLTDKGLFNKRKQLANSENEIYAALGLAFIPAELREDRGEIEISAKNNLPKLVELTDIRGDLHCHTNETDGSFTLEEMVEAARLQGYEYVAITDHSQSLKITNGMDEKRLLKQIKKIDKLNEKFSFPIEKQTDRILRAMDNLYFNILGHATGRLIHHRPPYQINLEKILQAAKERNCFIEVNAQPARLDINDLYCQAAKEIGVKVAISSDAHTTKGFNFMVLGVNQARRGWLEASDVINTYKLPQLKKLLRRK